jgi:hypothetical protein
VRLSALVAAAAVGLTGGAGYRAAGRLRAGRRWSAELATTAATVQDRVKVEARHA